MKQLIMTLLLVCAGLSVMAQTKQMTLQEAISYGESNHLSMLSANLDIKDAEQTIFETRAIGMPKVTTGLSWQRFLQLPTSLIPAEFFGGMPGEFQQVQFGTKNNLTLSLDANMLVFDASYLTGLRAATEYKDFVTKQIAQTKQTIKNNITKAYLGALILKENQTVLQKNIVNLQTVLNETKEMYKEGFVEQLDVDRLELSLLNLQTEEQNLKRQEEIALNALKFMMNYKEEEPLELTETIEQLLGTGFTSTRDEEVDLNNRAEIGVVDKGIELNKLDIERYENGKYPSVSIFSSNQLGLQTDQIFKSPNDVFPTVLVGLQVNYSIFDGFDRRSKTERARIALDKAEIQRRELVDAINLEVENARIAYDNAASQLESQKRNIALAERIYNTTQIKYKEGIGSSLEVTQAEQSLYQTQANYLNALYGLLSAKADLDIALGK